MNPARRNGTRGHLPPTRSTAGTCSWPPPAANTGFDPTPVLALHEGHTDRTVAAQLGVKIATVRSWRIGRRGVNVHAADRIAVASGAHPLELWPDWLERGR